MSNFPRFVVGLVLLTTAGAALAQPGRIEGDAPRKYVPFKIDPNYQKLLKSRLQFEKDMGPLKDLVKQIAADPQKFKLDPQMLKNFKLDDPQLKQFVKDWISHDPDMKQALQDWLKGNAPDKVPGTSEELKKTLKSLLDEPKGAPNVEELPAAKVIELPRAKEDPFAKMAERAMKNAEQSKLGDWLRDSPAWRDALTDLQASLDNPKVSGWDLGELTRKLGMPNEKAWNLGEGWLSKLRDLPSPKMDGWKVDFKLPAVGQMPAMPNVNGPSLPNVDVPSLPTMSTAATWLLFLLLFVLVGWWLYRWSWRASVVADERARLGPWPVRPEAVTTRTELVQAFDYLALLTLGLKVQSWNHHAIAERWRQRDAVAANAVARLYEQARYTDTAEQLPDAERNEARRLLRQLAEAY